jgi:GntR family transcriptional regulator
MSDTSRHRLVADALRDEIARGMHPRGSRLPSEHALAAHFGVARGTVRQALAALRADGAIAVRAGARSIVLGPARTQGFGELQSFTAWAHGLGERPGGRAATGAEALALGISEGDEVLGLMRVRLLGGRRVMIERTAFLCALATILGRADLEGGSIYAQLARHGVEIVRAHHTIDAIAAGTADARLLGVPRRAALLRDRRVGLDAAGTPLEVSDDRYRPEAVTFGVDNATTASPLTRRSTKEHDVDRDPA